MTEAVTDTLSKCLVVKSQCQYVLKFGWYVYCDHPLHTKFRTKR